MVQPPSTYQRIGFLGKLSTRILVRNFSGLKEEDLYYGSGSIHPHMSQSRRLKVSPSRVRAMIKAKRLKAMKVGHEWLIDPKGLDAVKDRKVGRPRKSRKSTKK